MSDQKDELSDDEMDALFRELEGKASGTAASKQTNVDADDGEDIEAFLRALEESENSATNAVSTQSAQVHNDDPFANQFAELEKASTTQIAKSTQASGNSDKKQDQRESKAKKRKTRPPKEIQSEADETAVAPAAKANQSASKSKRRWAVLLLFLFAGIPVLLAWWLLGIFLAQWVSAGWLIAIVALSALLAVPVFIRNLIQRGRYSFWLLASCIVWIVALIVPIPEYSGALMAKYGHWPATTVGQLADFSENYSLVRASHVMASWSGEQFSSQAAEQAPLRLGSEEVLNGYETAPSLLPQQVPGTDLPLDELLRPFE